MAHSSGGLAFMHMPDMGSIWTTLSFPFLPSQLVTFSAVVQSSLLVQLLLPLRHQTEQWMWDGHTAYGHGNALDGTPCLCCLPPPHSRRFPLLTKICLSL
uniref:Uncharacterized protein n=1 Tax=Dunaliella tertiolecta TaxID=3047 RepID=A0A7S3R975_DUNTE